MGASIVDIKNMGDAPEIQGIKILKVLYQKLLIIQ